MEEFIQVLRRNMDRNLLVLCHDDADSDALGAACVLASVLDADMAVPRTVSEHARELQYRLRMKVIFQPDVSKYDLAILVDTADPQQLPGCMPKEYLLIDHHHGNKLLAGALAAFHEESDSACQLVWRVCRRLERRLDANLALALGAGIMGDTRYLATAANSTLIDLAMILEEGGVAYNDLLRVLRVTSRIEREVRLQAALSARLLQVGNCLVVAAVPQRNYVYYVAMMLLELGADIAVTGFQQQENCFIRLAKNPAVAQCLNMYEVLTAAVRDLPRSNLWGNAEYAGFNGQADAEAVIGAVLARLESVQAEQGLCQCRDAAWAAPGRSDKP